MFEPQPIALATPFPHDSARGVIELTRKTTVALLLVGSLCSAAHLSPQADLAFGNYVANVEARIAQQHAGADTHLATLNVERSHRATMEHQLISGEIPVEPLNPPNRDFAGALLHHWRAAAFVPHATAEEMLTLLRDYDDFSSYYAPEVTAAHAVTDDGETAILAVRLKKQKVRTIVLDAEYRVETRLAAKDRGYSYSRSTHIWQIDNPGTPHERRRREGDDEGFLWHLNSYWSFAQARGGLWIECEAVSLTRDVPAGLGWLIAPIVQDLPSEALQFTLKATKAALMTIANRKPQAIKA